MVLNDEEEEEGRSHRKGCKVGIKKLCIPAEISSFIPPPPPYPNCQSVHQAMISPHASPLPHQKLFSSLDLHLVPSMDCFTCEFRRWLSALAAAQPSASIFSPCLSLLPANKVQQVLKFCCRGQVFIGESRQSAAQGASSLKWDFVCYAPAALV